MIEPTEADEYPENQHPFPPQCINDYYRIHYGIPIPDKQVPELYRMLSLENDQSE